MFSQLRLAAAAFVAQWSEVELVGKIPGSHQSGQKSQLEKHANISRPPQTALVGILCANPIDKTHC